MKTKELSRFLELISAKDLIKTIKILFDVDGIYISGMSDSNTSTIVMGKFSQPYEPLVGTTIYAPSANEMYKRIKMINDDVQLSIDNSSEVDKLELLGGIFTQKIPLIKKSVAGTFLTPTEIEYDVIDMEITADQISDIILLCRSILKSNLLEISILNNTIYFNIMEGNSSSANYTIDIPETVPHENLPGGIIFNKIDLLKILTTVGKKINIRIGIHSDGMLYICAVDNDETIKVEYFLVN